MAGGNAEIVRRLIEEFNAGDPEAWREIVAEDVVWDITGVAIPGAGVYQGHDGFVSFFTQWLSTWEDPKLELLETVEIGDSVAAAYRWTGRGKGSGIEIDGTFYGVYDIRDDRIVRFRSYATREEAIEAATTG